MKICTCCKVEKPFDCFTKRKNRKCGYMSHCKECRVEKEKVRQQEKKDSIADSKKAHYYQNHERLKAKQREYNAKNKEKRKAYVEKNRLVINESHKKWRNSSPVNVISDRFRRRLNYALTTLGIKKNRSSLEFLGCTLEFFKEHIEKQFLKGMGWVNREEWHIDHIIPMVTAKTEEDVIRLSHFTNLRPLWKRENLSKNKAVTHLI